MIRRSVLVIAIVSAVLVAPATAQEGGYRAVDNPFQEGFEFAVNSDLEPMVEIDGIRWNRFGLHVKGGKEIDPDREMPVTVELTFVNTTAEGVRVLVIALLEDSIGNLLHRVECSRVGVGADRAKESTQKFKIEGSALERMSHVYLFFEIE